MNKKSLWLVVLIFLLLCRFLYPHTRLAFKRSPHITSRRHLNIQSAKLKPGQRTQVKPVGIRKLASYSSSDFRIASVSPSGTVHALQPGTAIIYVKQGERIYKCRIIVSK